MKLSPQAAGLASALSVLFFSCGSGTSLCAAEERKLQIVTTLLPVYCFTVNVAGGLAEVENLLPRGVGPHDFQLSPKDVQKLNRADLVILNGLGLEAWLTKATDPDGPRISERRVAVAAGFENELIGIKPAPSDGGDREASRPFRVRGGGVKGQESNPHVWLDPRLASHAVRNILSALQKADPPRAARYATNAEGYLKKLESLDAELRQLLQPVRDKPFVTSHDAYAYFVRRYDLRLAGVVERVPDIEPSPRELANLYQTIREKRARVIFAEPQFSSKLVRQMARDLGLEVAELDPMETGEPTASAYEEGMRRIAGTLLQHLR